MPNVQSPTVAEEAIDILSEIGVPRKLFADGTLEVRTPISGEVIGRVKASDRETTEQSITTAHDAFLEWRTLPAPRRGELVRLLGEELRREKTALGRLVTIETGKIVSEGLGEVQEMIDICVYAAGLSRQLAGLTIASERPNHRMMETWHPLGVTGVISAFNFPVAVWSWNAALAFVCGNSVVWKPSEKTPLCALAIQALFDRAAARFGGGRPVFQPFSSEDEKQERCWSIILECRSYLPRGRPEWADRSVRDLQYALPVRFSN